jgi:hypothetical protein
MNAAEKNLVLLMRIIAVVSACAVAAIFMPFHCMSATHEMLGLGPLPNIPVVNYLTRSVSLLYTLHAVLFWLVASDLRRYRPIAAGLIGWLLAFGVIVLGIDIAAGVPWFWIAGEGPVVLILGMAMALLFVKAKPDEREM